MSQMLGKVLLLVALATACPGAFGSTASEQSTRSVVGTLVGPEGFAVPADTVVALRGADGARRTTLPRVDGTFKFFGVPDGVYYVEVDATGLQFLPLKVAVAGGGASVTASSPDMPSVADVPYPLRVPAVAGVAYFEARQGFNVVAWLKTPYGAMIAFMVGSMVLMPLLKVDPEEYKAMVEEKERLGQTIRGSGGGGGSRKND